MLASSPVLGYDLRVYHLPPPPPQKKDPILWFAPSHQGTELQSAGKYFLMKSLQLSYIPFSLSFKHLQIYSKK